MEINANKKDEEGLHHQLESWRASESNCGRDQLSVICVGVAEGSTFNLTQNTPFRKNGVALPDFIHFLALAGVVGISGLRFLSTTGTNIVNHSCGCVYYPIDITESEWIQAWGAP